MEDLNYKLAGLRDTVKKIKKEIMSFEENESKNIKKRTNTLSNKVFRPSSYTKKQSINKLNKRLMKNYFKLSLKERKFYENKKNRENKDKNNIVKEIMTPIQLNKNENKQLKEIVKSFKNNKISNNGANSKDINLYKNNTITDINTNNNSQYNMNNLFVKYMSTRNKDYYKESSDINNNEGNQIDKVIMTYSNNDLRKKIIKYSIKNKNKEQIYNDDLLYNTYNNNNTNNNENFYKHINNSAHFNIKKNNNKNNRTKNINISNLLKINKIEDQSYSNINTNNNNLFHFNNSINIKKKPKKNINKNHSYNCKTKVNSNFTPNYNTDNNIKKTNKNPKIKYTKNDYHCGNSFRTHLNNNEGSYLYGNKLYNYQTNLHRDYNSTQRFFNYNTKPKIFPMNNTINYISNKKDIDLYFDNDEKENFNKNKLKNIIGDYSIGDLYLKAKLFEKCGEHNFNNFCNNYCETNDVINNLNKYKKYLIKIKEEENQYKRQINVYQKLCKKIMKKMNPNQINNIIGEIEENFIGNHEDDQYYIEQIKFILPN